MKKILSLFILIMMCSLSGNTQTKENYIKWLNEQFEMYCYYDRFIINECVIKLPDNKNRDMWYVFQTRNINIITTGRNRGWVRVAPNKLRKVLSENTDSKLIEEINRTIERLSTFCNNRSAP